MEVSCGRSARGTVTAKTLFDLLRYQLPHARERILDDQTLDRILILCNKLDGDCAAYALAVYEHLLAAGLSPFLQVIQPCLSILHEASLAWLSGTSTITPIFKHQDRETKTLGQNSSNRKAMTDVPRVSMEHEDRDVPFHLMVAGADEVCVQSLAIGSR